MTPSPHKAASHALALDRADLAAQAETAEAPRFELKPARPPRATNDAPDGQKSRLSPLERGPGKKLARTGKERPGASRSLSSEQRRKRCPDGSPRGDKRDF